LRILTFDIEDWFHIEFENNINTWNSYPSRIEVNIERILDLLQKRNQTASFFCLGWIAERYPQILKKIDSCNYEIGSHSYDHKLIYEKTPEEFEEDLKRSLYSIEDAIGKKIKLFRAPAFSINEKTPWVFEILCKYGIETDASVFPAKRDFGGFPDFKYSRPVIIDYRGIRIKEFPVNTYRIAGFEFVFSGGGYFRLFPYFLIRHFIKESDYVIMYLHPRDLDPDQPLLKGLKGSRRFKSYVGLKNCYLKLEKTLSDYKFFNINGAIEQIDWTKADVIYLQ